MLKESEINSYLLSFDNTFSELSEKGKVILYKVKKNDNESLFAVVYHESDPVRISLRCDEILAKRLRETYETVMTGVNLNRKEWNTIVCTGQLSGDQIFDLIRLSYQLTVSL
jgi:predicted DNA-binding protein (MmcQ/YjbR family)